jgi:hypothetical protein
VRGQRAAVEIVRRAAQELERDAQRELLERELAARGVVKSPSWIEHTLDHLHDAPAEQWRAFGRGLVGIAAAAKTLVDLARDKPTPALSPPDWLRPPARAGYRAPLQRPARWTRVEGETTARELLDEIYAAIPQLVPQIDDSATVQAWLDRVEGDPPRIGVCVGQHRVGILSERDSEAYEPAMSAAAERDEVPRTEVRLTPRPKVGYLIELRVPAASSRS